MSKETKIRDLIYNIRRNYPNSPSTFGPCANNCGRLARGSGACAYCYEDELAKIVGKPLASDFHKHTLAAARCIDYMMEE